MTTEDMTAPERIAIRWEPGKAVTSGPLMTHPEYTQYVRADLALQPSKVADDRLADRAMQKIRDGWSETADRALSNIEKAISTTAPDPVAKAIQVFDKHRNELIFAAETAKHSQACDGEYNYVGYAAAEAAFYAMRDVLTALAAQGERDDG